MYSSPIPCYLAPLRPQTTSSAQCQNCIRYKNVRNSKNNKKSVSADATNIAHSSNIRWLCKTRDVFGQKELNSKSPEWCWVILVCAFEVHSKLPKCSAADSRTLLTYLLHGAESLLRS
jgi:hypothetical protein